uniref:Uncharacterized protein n=1 Tax=Strongyloides venezuelensis TaxID=75913 RepID=A0A0K0FP52_STRVS
MLLKLYCLGAALALMALPTQPLGPQQETLFPYISRDITNTTFPFDLNVTTNSDVVLVKCPNFGYRHKKNDDSFTPNSEVFMSGSTYSPSDNSFAWVPLLKSKTGPTKLKCGKINLEDVGNPRYDWIFNVIWQNGTDNESIMVRENRINSIPQNLQKCNLLLEEPIIFSRMKDGIFSLIPNPNFVEHLYVNQMFYYFEKPQGNGKTKNPCGILKIYGNKPTIKLQPYESTSEATPFNGLYKINLLETGQQTIKVVLDTKNNLEYYQDEKVIIAKMRYVHG